MSDPAGPSLTLTVGSVLSDSIRLLLRHWLILVVTFVALAEGFLLNLGLLGRCFADQAPICPEVVHRLDEGPQWIIKIISSQTVGLIVFAVASYVFYTSKHLGIPAVTRLRGSARRAVHLLGRIALVWIVMAFPLLLLDLGLWWALIAFPEYLQSTAMQWLTYLFRAAAVILFLASLQARLAFYQPSAAYSLEPDSWRESWRGTRRVARPLFIVYLLIAFVESASEVGLVVLLYKTPMFFDFVDFVSDLIGVRSNYVMRNLGELTAMVLVGTPAGMLQLAVSLVAFKKTMPAMDETTAGIFD